MCKHVHLCVCAFVCAYVCVCEVHAYVCISVHASVCASVCVYWVRHKPLKQALKILPHVSAEITFLNL